MGSEIFKNLKSGAPILFDFNENIAAARVNNTLTSMLLSTSQTKSKQLITPQDANYTPREILITKVDVTKLLYANSSIHYWF